MSQKFENEEPIFSDSEMTGFEPEKTRAAAEGGAATSGGCNKTAIIVGCSVGAVAVIGTAVALAVIASKSGSNKDPENKTENKEEGKENGNLTKDQNFEEAVKSILKKEDLPVSFSEKCAVNLTWYENKGQKNAKNDEKNELPHKTSVPCAKLIDAAKNSHIDLKEDPYSPLMFLTNGEVKPSNDGVSCTFSVEKSGENNMKLKTDCGGKTMETNLKAHVSKEAAKPLPKEAESGNLKGGKKDTKWTSVLHSLTVTDDINLRKDTPNATFIKMNRDGLLFDSSMVDKDGLPRKELSECSFRFGNESFSCKDLVFALSAGGNDERSQKLIEALGKVGTFHNKQLSLDAINKKNQKEKKTEMTMKEFIENKNETEVSNGSKNIVLKALRENVSGFSTKFVDADTTKLIIMTDGAKDPKWVEVKMSPVMMKKNENNKGEKIVFMNRENEKAKEETKGDEDVVTDEKEDKKEININKFRYELLKRFNAKSFSNNCVAELSLDNKTAIAKASSVRDFSVSCDSLFKSSKMSYASDPKSLLKDLIPREFDECKVTGLRAGFRTYKVDPKDEDTLMARQEIIEVTMECSKKPKNPSDDPEAPKTKKIFFDVKKTDDEITKLVKSDMEIGDTYTLFADAKETTGIKDVVKKAGKGYVNREAFESARDNLVENLKKAFVKTQGLKANSEFEKHFVEHFELNGNNVKEFISSLFDQSDNFVKLEIETSKKEVSINAFNYVKESKPEEQELKPEEQELKKEEKVKLTVVKSYKLKVTNAEKMQGESVEVVA